MKFRNHLSLMTLTTLMTRAMKDLTFFLFSDVEHTFLIPLETDHVDGDHKNDDSSNLRRICRQCHANTPTFNKNSVARKNIQKEEENKLK